MDPFLAKIATRPLVCDGAMGTMLYANGVFVNRPFEELNLTQPNLVTDVHRRYLDAGAEVLETNTFGANRVRLEGFGLVDQLTDLNVGGVRLARAVAGQRAYVAASVGPLGVPVGPGGAMGVEEAERHFREQAEALVLDGGLDLFVLETFGVVDEIGAAVRAVRAVSDLPVVAQMTTGDNGDAADGTPPETFAARLVDEGAAVVGVNCSTGPASMLETVERLGAATTAPLAAQPNAGLPRLVEGRTLYMSSPEYLASYAKRFVGLGVKLVGGCCGTTPAHIRHIRDAIGQPA